MNGIDTNILIYSYDVDEKVKQPIAAQLLQSLVASALPTLIPWQVAGEFLNCLRRWENEKKISPANVIASWKQLTGAFPIVCPTDAMLAHYFHLHAQYSLSHWDSMLLAACIEAGITTLYSEDLSHGATYDTVKVINPFLP